MSALQLLPEGAVERLAPVLQQAKTKRVFDSLAALEEQLAAP